MESFLDDMRIQTIIDSGRTVNLMMKFHLGKISPIPTIVGRMHHHRKLLYGFTYIGASMKFNIRREGLPALGVILSPDGSLIFTNLVRAGDAREVLPELIDIIFGNLDQEYVPPRKHRGVKRAAVIKNDDVVQDV